MRYMFLRFPGGKQKAVTFSYDDGCADDVTTAKFFEKYNLRATFNINSGNIAKVSGGWHLTKDEIYEHIFKKGYEIAVHGEYHKAPGNVRAIEGIKDVLNCRLGLEKEFDTIIRGMAYPDSGITVFRNNTSYEEIKNYLKDLGIAYSRTLGSDNNSFELPTDWYKWIPTAHHNNPKLFDYIDEFLSITGNEYIASTGPKLFYIWGHSYEFGRDGWDRLEKICEKLANNDDIWYATNIEIYDYVNAYNSLIFNAKGDVIYNPSLYTLYFVVDTKPFSIKPGETLKIEL